jgi:polyisoprenoid-binding protein YceI
VAVDGELTLLGVARTLRLDLDHFHCGLVVIGLRYVCGANATAKFSRSAFGMDRYVNFGVGDEVRVTIQIEAQREAPSLPTVAP